MEDEFFVNLSKDLYGTKSLAHLARERFEVYRANHPDEIVCVHPEGYLCTMAEMDAALAPIPIESVTLNGEPLLIHPYSD